MASVLLSAWFLVFFLFVFLTLAIVKCQHEPYMFHKSGGTNVEGRAYTVDDLTAMTALAAGSSFAALVVFTLYIQSSDVYVLCGRPVLL